jgi:hypothetical protein
MLVESKVHCGHTILEGLGLGLPLHPSVLDIIQETSFIRLIRRLRV